MANEVQTKATVEQQTQEAVLAQRTQTASLTVATDKLAKFGGFSFLESAISDIQNLNPARKARKQIFLSDETKKEERKELKQTLTLWLDLLANTKDISEMIDKSKEKETFTSELLKKNQLEAVETVKELERSYRQIQLFYKNTESDKLRNITIVNASPEQVRDLDNSRFIDFIAQEFKQHYDRLDLRENYSLLVLPGHLGKNSIVEKWCKIAYENKVMLFTDFLDLEKPDDVVDMFFTANHTGGDAFRANTCMACNWLVGRSKYKELDEAEDLHVSPAAALAGKVYYTLMSQVTAGKKFGGINEVDGVTFQLKKSDISQLEKMGLIPMVNEYGKVMAFSAKTLFNGDNLGLQTYSVVRVFDYIAKVLIDFLNRRAFENWNTKTEKDLRIQIIKFLDSIQGADRLIEKFKITRFERNPKQKDQIFLDLHITPFFPAKSFIIKLDGTKGDDDVDWETLYEQQAG
ncbi:MAG: DUF5458 family protein [Tannerella sp.]|jgi:hypothetical protein|nr:DUF5458 family protein [Tannerella sp.]